MKNKFIDIEPDPLTDIPSYNELINFYLQNQDKPKIKTTMESQEKMLSLFEYLGKPAGQELGKKVFELSKQNKIKTQTRDISNSKYTGKVMLYPESFLKNYFKSDLLF